MTLQVYAPAIRDALQRGDVRGMESLLRHAKKVHAEQGDLGHAISELQEALDKLGLKKST